MRLDFEFKGHREFERRLLAADAKMQRQSSVRIARSGATYYARRLRKVLPRRSGLLRKSIGTQRDRSERNQTVFNVGVRGAARFYAHILEFGSKYIQGSRLWEKTFKSSFNGILRSMQKKGREEVEKF